MTPERNFYDTLKNKLSVYYANEVDRRGAKESARQSNKRMKSNANFI